MKEELGIITEPGFGLRDSNSPMLWFSVSTLGGGVLLCFRREEALDFVKTNNVTNVSRLAGKPCVISFDERGLAHFVRMFKA